MRSGLPLPVIQTFRPMIIRKLLEFSCLAILLLVSNITNAAQPTVVIDPGHGGGSPSGSALEKSLSSPNNAKTPSGVMEKDLTLELSMAIQRALEIPEQERGPFHCVLTRTTDTNPDFITRATIAAESKPEVLISIHFNASTRHNATGTVTMIHNKQNNPNYARDLAFADGLAAAVSSAVAGFIPGAKPRATIDDSNLHGGSGSNFFYQLSKHPSMKDVPTCFLEVEFIDRPDVDEKLIAHRKDAFPKIAQSIARYLSEYLALARTPSTH